MSTTTTTTSSSSKWTVVRHRNRRHHSASCSSSSATTPCVPPPTASPIPPSLLSSFHHKLSSSISRLSSSPFLRRFLSSLPSQALPAVQIVVYGLGSPSSSLPSRLQLSLALLLRSHLRLISPLLLYDPSLSPLDIAALSSLPSCLLLPHDERAARPVLSPTLFYMPHCDAALYANLLAANCASSGGKGSLHCVVVLGNSFSEYAAYAEGPGRGTRVGRDARRVVNASYEAVETRIDRGDDGWRLEDEGDPAMFAAFHSTSWHYFEREFDLDGDHDVAEE